MSTSCAPCHFDNSMKKCCLELNLVLLHRVLGIFYVFFNVFAFVNCVLVSFCVVLLF